MLRMVWTKNGFKQGEQEGKNPRPPSIFSKEKGQKQKWKIRYIVNSLLLTEGKQEGGRGGEKKGALALLRGRCVRKKQSV